MFLTDGSYTQTGVNLSHVTYNECGDVPWEKGYYSALY